LRGNEAGQAANQRYAHDAHDDHGRAACAPDADAGKSKNDPKRGKGTGNSGRSLFPKSPLPVFALLFAFEEII
jgi:hypothetical protein